MKKQKEADEINDKKSFLKFIDDYVDNDKKRIYRGVSNGEYKLIPSIARKYNYKDKDRTIMLNQNDENLILRLFVQKTYSLLHNHLNTFGTLDKIALAQHHGLPTRLLDWTFNPLVALYFAVEKDIKEKDMPYSKIYILDEDINDKIYIGKETASFEDLKNIKKVEYFYPSYVHQRIINQNGLFTIHPYRWTEFEHDSLREIKINAKFRRELRTLLHRMGINEMTMFPDLDGISKHIQWLQTSYY